MFNVKFRAIAMLIHTFLAQAISPLFTTNVYLNSLYRWHVLENREIPDPGRPPYYSEAFFSIIKDVHKNTPLNVTWITLKQWYQILLEKGVTHTCDDQDSPPVLIKSNLEESRLDDDFSLSYRMTRLFGLSPDQKSFLFKLVQNLLPTRERLHRCKKSQSSSCLFCNEEVDLAEHLLSCPQGTEVTSPLLSCLSSQVDNLTNKDVIQMKISTSESWEHPASWLVSTCLMYVWEERLAGRRAKLNLCRAELIARVNLLKSTRWKNFSLHNSAVLLEEALNLHFV